jgi:hypothetical protein
MCAKEKGTVLVAVIIVAIIFALVGWGVLILAQQQSVLTRIDIDKAKAFYLAEAGLGKLQETLQVPITVGIDGLLEEPIEETFEQGSYKVELVEEDANIYAVSTGVSGQVQKQIRVKAAFLAPPFEDAVYARNQSGGAWAFQLRGKDNPVPNGSGETGGKDIMNGNISVDGDVAMYEQSSVNKAPAPNKWNLKGDVSATGTINLFNTATIAGSRYPNSLKPDPVDLKEMDYAHNNTHNVAQIFQEAGVASGYLPAGNELHDIFVKNPSDRSAECTATTGNDYFLEPKNVTGGGTQKDAPTPLHLGNDRVYYVDGDVWVHNKTSYGFTIDGKVTIVATGDIHICDNLKYKDVDSVLGLVALGKYDSAGNLTSGGNIYFGDPRYGTMYCVSAMMFAAKDFLFNTDPISRKSAEPTTGFTITGCFAAMNEVLVERDWYTKVSGTTSTPKPAHFDTATGQWFDAETKTSLTSTQIGTLKHYQMIINYDDRVRSPQTQPPMLPRGTSSIFAGFSNWEEM